MKAEAEMIPESLQKAQVEFQAILSDEELSGLVSKYAVEDERKRKLDVRSFFWLMVMSAGEPSNRGSLLSLIGFFLGAIALLSPKSAVMSLTKTAVSKRLTGISWYLFRGVYNHLLVRYETILGSEAMKFLGQFKDAFVVDGSVITLSKHLAGILESVHKGQASLKLNTKFSLKVAAVTKLQVSSGKRHDSQFSFVTKAADCLYLVDLGYWSFRLMKKIIDAGSFFVMRLKGNCDPLIVKVAAAEYQHLVGLRLSAISAFLDASVASGTLELTVQLSKAKKPTFKDELRLVGLFHDAQWRFYVTNLVDPRFTPQFIYELYAQRWQIEIFFNLIKHVLTLETIISKTKNGIMIEIYSALIFYLFTRIVIALAAQKTGYSIHAFSFERAHKLIRGVLLSHFHQFLQPSLLAVEAIFQRLIVIVAAMAFPQRPHKRTFLIDHFA
jgi:Transposase DDE domain